MCYRLDFQHYISLHNILDLHSGKMKDLGSLLQGNFGVWRKFLNLEEDFAF